jgi:hypothetical protein
MPSISIKLTSKLPSPQSLYDKLRRALVKGVTEDIKSQISAYNKEIDDISLTKRPLINKTIDIGQYLTFNITVTEKNPRLQIWKWRFITGTKPHIIKVRNARFLRFQLGYSALMRGGDKSFSGPTLFRKQVHHPGYRPVKVIDYINIRFGAKRADLVKRISKTELSKW